MIKDLNLAGESTVTCEAQVCIVGAGTAGLFLAHLLRLKGLSVVMLEAGDAVARSGAELSQSCEQRGILYRGAESGRSFGLGGTSVLWGGQMISMVESDFGARQEVGFEGWPIGYSEVSRYFPVVRQHLGLGSGTFSLAREPDSQALDEFPDLRQFGDDFVLRLSEWLPFKRRNFANAFAPAIKDDPDLVIWLHAAVTGMTQSQPGGDLPIEAIAAQSPDGNSLLVRASVVVICAGALESTRLLLAFDESTLGSITRGGAPLGRYFSDHLSVTCGRFVCRDMRRFNLAVAPIFRNGVMRTPRLELTATAQRQMGLTSAFAHMTFVTRGDSGFDIVRNILRRRQGEQQSLNFTPGMLSRLVRDLSAMVYWRGVHRRLWIPRHADLLLQVDIEQAPNPESRLYLSSECDALNRKRLVIDWRINPSDVRTIRKVTETVVAGWRQSPLNQIADLQATLPEKFDSFATLYDVYHPTGSIRMGSSPTNSVVDKDLRLWGTRNCYVTSTAVFPSSGSANPGITHLALTARLAEQIARQCFG
ncbi:MAG: GMC family oxidoreductase [Sulfuricellaceae bacterium]|nr:GMC family oxidoreductase [Sulfuricellaceae bacterium]